MWSLITLMLTVLTPHTRHTRPIPGRYPALKLGLQTEKSADFEKVTASLAPRSDAHGPKAHGSVLLSEYDLCDIESTEDTRRR